MSFGYLNLTHFSGTCSNSQGKAAKPVGTWTFILEGTEIPLRGRLLPGSLSPTAGGSGDCGQVGWWCRKPPPSIPTH